MPTKIILEFIGDAENDPNLSRLINILQDNLTNENRDPRDKRYIPFNPRFNNFLLDIDLRARNIQVEFERDRDALHDSGYAPLHRNNTSHITIDAHAIIRGINPQGVSTSQPLEPTEDYFKTKDKTIMDDII